MSRLIEIVGAALMIVGASILVGVLLVLSEPALLFLLALLIVVRVLQ